MTGPAKSSTRTAWPIVCGLLLLFGVMAWSGVRDKSCTFDEIAHLTAGCSYWLYGDYRLHPENGVLPQRLEALPLLASGVNYPSRDDPHWHESQVWELGYTFFNRLGNDVRTMLWQARGVVVLVGMALGGIVYVWSRRLFGMAGGLFSLTLFVFCPTMLAHSALATSDMTVTTMFVAALGSSWMVLHKVTPLTVVASGVALGLLAVSKMSAIVILPVIFLLFVLRMVARRPLLIQWRNKTAIVVAETRQCAILLGVAACQALLTIGVIWLAYGFQPTIFHEATVGVDRMARDASVNSLSRGSSLGFAVRVANDWRLLPEPFLYGFAYALESSQARVSFLNGEFGTSGFAWFFPTALLIKTPLPTIACALAAGFTPVAIWLRGSTAGRRRVKRYLYRAAPLLVFLVIYWWVALGSNLNIGHRHIMPTYPMVFILCGTLAAWFRSPLRWVRALPIVAMAWLIVSSLGIYPHYLAYFNELAGGPRLGYRHLVDSSLDWGQDLPGLKRWLDKRRTVTGESLPAYLSYFGTGNPRTYGIEANWLPSCPDWRTQMTPELGPGYYCISATMLQCVYQAPFGPWTEKYESTYQQLLVEAAEIAERLRQDPQLPERAKKDPQLAGDLARWNQILAMLDAYRLNRLCAYLRLREPDDTAGYSILIYELSAEDLDNALRQPLSRWIERESRRN